MPPIWLIKGILCFALAGDLLFMREYWAATHGGWLHDSIGLTLMVEAMAFFGTVFLIVLSVFLGLSHTTSEALAWADDALLFICGAAYWWRTLVFHQERDRPYDAAYKRAGKEEA
jgi:hypothetical protein